MGRKRILGNEECIHVNKEDRSVCGKQGRYGAKHTVWNTKHKLAAKSEYIEFLHNDGSRHYIKYKDYLLNKSRGHIFEQEINRMHELSHESGKSGHLMLKLSEILKRHQHQFTDQEITNLKAGVNFYGTVMNLLTKSAILTREACNYIIKEGKKPPAEITEQVTQITKILQDYNMARMHGADDPFVNAIIEIYNKYEVPYRKETKRLINQKQKQYPLKSSKVGQFSGIENMK
jgi:hypothetical protein